jgi:hypothetical protein
MQIPPGEFPYPISHGPEESRYLLWVRNHSNYLTPRGFLDYLRLIAVLVRGILINFLTLLPALLLLAVLLSWWHNERLDKWVGAEVRSPFVLTPWALGIVLVFFLLFPVVIRVFKVRQQRQSISQGSESSVKLRDLYERLFGGALLLLGIVALAEIFPLALHWFHAMRGAGGRDLFAGGAAASSVVALSSAGKILAPLGKAKKNVVLALIALVGALLPLLVVLYVAEHLVFPGTWKFDPPWIVLQVIGAVLVAGTTLTLLYSVGRVGAKHSRLIFSLLGLVVAVALALWLVVPWLGDSGRVEPHWLFGRLEPPSLFGWVGPHGLFVLTSAFVLWLYSWLTVDVNLTSLSGFYRDRLASAYLVGQNTSNDVDIEEDINLMDICQYEHGSTAPYHLVNVALNLQGSKDIGIRDRKSDFFIFSKRFIGGRMTGYTRSADMDAVFPQMDLATAMAISAAAASPNMGRATSPALVAIMTLLNARLGYWVPNPRRLALWTQEQEARHPELAGKEPARMSWTFQDVFAAELQEIRARWGNAYPNGTGGGSDSPQRALAGSAEPTPAHGLVGLGFSGGGIRSATINLGIVQALQEAGVFRHVDYISTVSGGGYLGSSLSTLMRARDLPETRPSSRMRTLPHRFHWRVRPMSFIREMFSRLDETHNWVNLSDGGHIENLATIELLRRRCKYIITGDAEADPSMHFPSLAALIRFARIDLGIDIRIDLDQLRIPEGGGLTARERVSRQHFALGRITYPGEAEPGYLLYFKSSVTGDEDEVISEYRARKSTFPHESTADQFFDEGQFEAYRALGEHMARQALALSPGGKDTYEGLEAWFGALAEQLPHRWEKDPTRVGA